MQVRKPSLSRLSKTRLLFVLVVQALGKILQRTLLPPPLLSPIEDKLSIHFQRNFSSPILSKRKTESTPPRFFLPLSEEVLPSLLLPTLSRCHWPSLGVSQIVADSTFFPRTKFGTPCSTSSKFRAVETVSPTLVKKKFNYLRFGSAFLPSTCQRNNSRNAKVAPRFLIFLLPSPSFIIHLTHPPLLILRPSCVLMPFLLPYFCPPPLLPTGNRKEVGRPKWNREEGRMSEGTFFLLRQGGERKRKQVKHLPIKFHDKSCT